LTAVFRTQIFKEILKLKKDKGETNFRLQVLAYSFLLVSEVIFFYFDELTFCDSERIFLFQRKVVPFEEREEWDERDAR